MIYHANTPGTCIFLLVVYQYLFCWKFFLYWKMWPLSTLQTAFRGCQTSKSNDWYSLLDLCHINLHTFHKRVNSQKKLAPFPNVATDKPHPWFPATIFGKKVQLICGFLRYTLILYCMCITFTVHYFNFMARASLINTSPDLKDDQVFVVAL